MSQPKKLTTRQRAFLEDLFRADLDEQAVLDKHGVRPQLYEQWLANEQFAEHLERRVARAYRESRMVLARFAPVAATKLVALTASEKEETARKACLDIISLDPGTTNASPDTSGTPPEPPVCGVLSATTAGRLLAALASEGESTPPRDPNAHDPSR